MRGFLTPPGRIRFARVGLHTRPGRVMTLVKSREILDDAEKAVGGLE